MVMPALSERLIHRFTPKVIIERSLVERCGSRYHGLPVWKACRTPEELVPEKLVSDYSSRARQSG